MATKQSFLAIAEYRRVNEWKRFLPINIIGRYAAQFQADSRYGQKKKKTHSL